MTTISRRLGRERRAVANSPKVIDLAASTGTVTPDTEPLGGTVCTGAGIPNLQIHGYEINSGSSVVNTASLAPTTGGGIPSSGADPGLRAVRVDQ